MLAVSISTWFAATIPVEVILAAGVVVLVGLAAGGVGLWRMFGAGPRRNRAYLRAREHLAKGEWEPARARIEEIKLLGVSTPEWQGRINNLEGECRRAAGDKLLDERKFEEALEHHLAAAKLLNTSPTEARDRILEGMVSELRTRVAGSRDERTAKLAQRILQMQPQHAEASFWLGLLHIKLNRSDQAQIALRTAAEVERKSVEPSLYLGMLLLREGKAKDGLRYLAEANKNAPNSVLVSWQLGMGLVVSGGDSSLAVRALQKAVAPEGLPKLAKNPERFWLEALPEGSYIGKLAGKQTFVCPILGSNVAGMLRQAKLALGQALFRLERTIESVAVLQDLLNDGEPTVAVLRALGIALCKLERFDDAYAHLRAAYEQDASKSPLTACYLAWAAIRARPSKPEDRPANVKWAVRVLADLAIPPENEPVRLATHVYSEARKVGVAVPVEDLARLCGAILTLNLVDPSAAIMIDLLAATAPQMVRPPHAFLYGWIAVQTGFRGEKDESLLLQIIQHEGLARDYFSQRNWDPQRVERLFLERWAESHQGFPEALGPDYPGRCEKFLLEQAKQQEESGNVEGTRATIELLRKLTPLTAATFDRAARLAYVRGDIDDAIRILTDWCTQLPSEPTPRIRLAAIEQDRGRTDEARQHLQTALGLVSGVRLATIALFGARLAIRANRNDEALALVERSLEASPGNAEALWLKAALCWRLQAVDSLRALAPQMERSAATDPRFYYMAAVCFIVADDIDAARTAARRVSLENGWQADGHHLMGVLHWRRGDFPGAASRLEAALQTPEHACLEHTKLILGRVRWEQGSTAEAAQLWTQLSSEARQRWSIEPVLAGAAYLAGVQSLRDGNAPAAADLFSRARELGCRERQLPHLHERAMVEAARESLAKTDSADIDALTPMLDRASQSRGPQQALAAMLLARVHRRRGRLAEAREALRRVSPPSSSALNEMAAIALDDKQLGQAEEILARVVANEPVNHAARLNLFWTRMSLGNVRGAAELLPPIAEGATTPEQKRFWTQLSMLLQGGTTLNIAFADMTAEEERQLLDALFRIGKLEATVPLLCLLAAARPQSREAKESQTLAMLRLGKQCFDRGDWLGAEKWLSPLAKARPSAAVRNLLGLNSCLTQDFAGGILHLQEAQRLAGDDPRLHQNLALAFTLQGDFDEAELCWGRYLGMMDKRLPRPPAYFDYHDHLRFQVLRYLGNQQYDREKWPEALAYLEEAHSLRPDLPELAERVFLLQVQVGKRAEARRTLNVLHQLRPKHGPYQLYELDLVEMRASADLEKLLDALARVVEQMLDDPAVQDKAVQRVLPTLQYRADYLTRVMREIREDLRRRYEDSPGWYDALRDLRSVKRDLRRLRQVVRYCTQLQVVEATRRRLDTLTDELDRKIEYCRRWEEDDR